MFLKIKSLWDDLVWRILNTFKDDNCVTNMLIFISYILVPKNVNSNVLKIVNFHRSLSIKVDADQLEDEIPN